MDRLLISIGIFGAIALFSQSAVPIIITGVVLAIGMALVSLLKSDSSPVQSSNTQPIVTGGKQVSPKASPDPSEAGSLSALVIDEPWVSMILNGKKTWEMRSRRTTKRGQIALIRKKSGTVVGVANLIDSLGPLGDAQLTNNMDKHQVPLSKIGNWRNAWVLESARPLRRPVSYIHPSGAVTWVTLDSSTSSRVLEQI